MSVFNNTVQLKSVLLKIRNQYIVFVENLVFFTAGMRSTESADENKKIG